MITVKSRTKDIEKNYKGECAIMSFEQWFVVKNLEKFKTMRELFVDSRSKETLELLLLAILTDNEEKYYSLAYAENQYSCHPYFMNGHDDVFVDVGAFVGDTIEKFIWSKTGAFRHIYCFEPGKMQFRALGTRCNRLIDEWALDGCKITLENAGIGDKIEDIALECSNGILPSISLLKDKTNLTSSEKVHIYTIDYYFRDIPLTFIKADIEGYEMNLLFGAKETIKRDKPKLALCTYHGSNDIFDFIQYLTDIEPEYKFALRHHSFTSSETVLYCFIE